MHTQNMKHELGNMTFLEKIVNPFTFIPFSNSDLMINVSEVVFG